MYFYNRITRVVQGLNAKKLCDINGMSIWLLKSCFKIILTPLTKLNNSSFENGIFPTALKSAKIIPIFKKDNPLRTNNYRPISILPVISKVYEKVFLNKIMQFLEHFQILKPEQFGFRKNQSTIDAVPQLVDSDVDGLDRREHVLSIFLDLSKVFDCVHHETLLHQLESHSVRGLPHRWLSSYLKDRDQSVQIADAMSEKVLMPYGVPQGSILGPVLFLIYINELKSSVQNGRVFQYADDTTLCFSSKTFQDLEVNAFVELNSCIQFLSDINLKTNETKSNAIKFSLIQKENALEPCMLLDDVLLKVVDTTTFLGIHLDQGLTWNDHVNKVCSKITSGIHAIRNLSRTCSFEVLRMAYFGLIYPHLSYGICLWGSCTQQQFLRVFRLQKKAVRIISKLDYRESCRDAFRELRLLTLPCLYILEVVLYCRSKCTLTQGTDIHTYGTRGRTNYRQQKHRTTAFAQLPKQVGVRLINRLPEAMKNLSNLSNFKTGLKRLLVSGVFYSVDEFLTSHWDD